MHTEKLSMRQTMAWLALLIGMILMAIASPLKEAAFFDSVAKLLFGLFAVLGIVMLTLMFTRLRFRFANAVVVGAALSWFVYVFSKHDTQQLFELHGAMFFSLAGFFLFWLSVVVLDLIGVFDSPKENIRAVTVIDAITAIKKILKQ